MTITSRPLALAGGAALLVGVLGAGMAIGAGASASPAATVSASAPGAASASTASSATDPTAEVVDAALAAFDQPGMTDPTALAAPATTAPALGLAQRIRRFARWKQLVHVALTVNRPAAGIQTFDLDHGTISGPSTGSLTIAEAGGSSVTLATDASTRVRKDGKKATLADLRSGDEVVAVSLADGAGNPRALLVVVPPVTSAGTAP